MVFVLKCIKRVRKKIKQIYRKIFPNELICKTVFNAKADKRADKIVISIVSIHSAESLVCSKYIDLTPYKTICLYGKFVKQHDGSTYFPRFGVIKNSLEVNEKSTNLVPDQAMITGATIYDMNNTGVKTVDISNISGEYRIGVYGIWDGEIYRIEVK